MYCKNDDDNDNNYINNNNNNKKKNNEVFVVNNEKYERLKNDKKEIKVSPTRSEKLLEIFEFQSKQQKDLLNRVKELELAQNKEKNETKVRKENLIIRSIRNLFSYIWQPKIETFSSSISESSKVPLNSSAPQIVMTNNNNERARTGSDIVQVLLNTDEKEKKNWQEDSWSGKHLKSSKITPKNRLRNYQNFENSNNISNRKPTNFDLQNSKSPKNEKNLKNNLKNFYKNEKVNSREEIKISQLSNLLLSNDNFEESDPRSVDTYKHTINCDGSKYFRFHDISFSRKNGYRLCYEDFSLIAATVEDSLVPPEYMESLLRSIKGFSPSLSQFTNIEENNKIIADSQTTVWHLGIVLLQAYLGRNAFCSLSLYKNQIECIEYDESCTIAISPAEKMRQKEGFKIFLDTYKTYMQINQIEEGEVVQVRDDFILHNLI